MKLEVIISGKGSVTVEQEVDWTRKEIQRLAEHSADLIVKTADQRKPFGFEGGAQAQIENASNWYVPNAGGIDSSVK